MNIITVAPSGKFETTDYNQGIDWLQSNNFTILNNASQHESKFSYLNGDDQERLDELNKGLNHPTADICWIARGGYGLNRLIPHLENSFTTHKPIVVGYSDASAILCHLWAIEKRKGLHAPNINVLIKQDDTCRDALLKILENKARTVNYPSFKLAANSQIPLNTPFAKGENLNAGSEISGTLIPVNLCVLTTLIGTPSMPSLNSSILMIEDLGEPPYKIDRLFTHLWASGNLKGVSAVIVGHLSDCGSNEKRTEAKKVIVDRCINLNIPVFTDFQFGHENPNWPIPFGCKASIKIDTQCQLIILEEVFE